MKKKWLIGGLATVMCASAMAGLTACNNDKPDGPDGPGGSSAVITGGIYDGTYTAGGFKQEAYFRFHEEGEIFEGKKTFYYQAYSGSNAMVKPLLGTYEIKDESVTVKCWPSAAQRSTEDGGVFEERTADKTLVCYSLDGQTEYFKTGWDTTENRLLGIPAATTELGVTINNNMGVGTYFANYCYLNSTEAKTDKGVELATYYCDTDTVRNASITIYHNKTYKDDKVTGAEAVNGTYTVSGSTYTLTAGTGATGGSLVTTATGATFTPTGSTAITMSTTRNRTALDGFVFTGSGTIQGITGTVNVTITLYDDNTAVAVGNSIGTINGTWREEGGFKYISFNGAEGMVEPDTDEDGTYYVYDFNGIDCRTESVEEEVEVLHTLTGKVSGYFDASLVLNSDGSATYTVNMPEAYGGTVVSNGTWTNTTATLGEGEQQVVFTITEGQNGLLTATMGEGAQAVTLTEQAKLSDYTFTGKVSGYFDASLVLNSNGTAAYTVNMPEAYGGTVVVNGTWTHNNGVPATATLGEGEQQVVFTITEVSGKLTATMGEGEQAVTLTEQAKLSDYTFTGKVSGYFDASLVLNSNGTATYTVNMPEAYGGTVVVNGSWTHNNGVPATATLGEGEQQVAFTISEGQNGALTATMGEGEQAVTLTYSAE